MTETFNSRLARVVCERGSHVCVGIDPDWAKFHDLYAGEIAEWQTRQSPSLVSADDSRMLMEAACSILIEACAPYASAFKPNAAFFESAGCGGAGIYEMPGIAARCAAGSPLPLAVFDGKRGDIGNTSACYAHAIFTSGGFDAATVNPLMGFDAVEPFLRDPDRGVFLLCLTSNPGAEDFLLKNDLYLRIAGKAVEWNRHGNVGLVVGATQAAHAAAVRRIAPDLPLLIPGVGAQGGSLAEILDAVDASNNPRFLINASRSIMFAPRPADCATQSQAAARAACALRDGIAAVTG